MEKKGEKREEKKRKEKINEFYLSVKIMPCHVRVACHINAT
jgi:hypothetical protein